MAVYFIQCPLGGPVKIGYSATVDGCQDRLKSIRIGSPRRLEIIHINHEAPREREQDLHRTFRKDRLRGEWFTPSKELAVLCGCRLTIEREYFVDQEQVVWQAGFDYANSEDLLGRERARANKTRATTVAIAKVLKAALEAMPDDEAKFEIWQKATRAYLNAGADIPPWLGLADPRTRA